MVYSKIYGFLPPSKVIDVDDGVAAVGYKSLSTPPLLILNRRTPLAWRQRKCIFLWMVRSSRSWRELEEIKFFIDGSERNFRFYFETAMFNDFLK